MRKSVKVLCVFAFVALLFLNLKSSAHAANPNCANMQVSPNVVRRDFNGALGFKTQGGNGNCFDTTGHPQYKWLIVETYLNNQDDNHSQNIDQSEIKNGNQIVVDPSNISNTYNIQAVDVGTRTIDICDQSVSNSTCINSPIATAKITVRNSYIDQGILPQVDYTGNCFFLKDDPIAVNITHLDPSANINEYAWNFDNNTFGNWCYNGMQYAKNIYPTQAHEITTTGTISFNGQTLPNGVIDNYDASFDVNKNRTDSGLGDPVNLCVGSSYYYSGAGFDRLFGTSTCWAINQRGAIICKTLHFFDNRCDYDKAIGLWPIPTSGNDSTCIGSYTNKSVGFGTRQLGTPLCIAPVQPDCITQYKGTCQKDSTSCPANTQPLGGGTLDGGCKNIQTGRPEDNNAPGTPICCAPITATTSNCATVYNGTCVAASSPTDFSNCPAAQFVSASATPPDQCSTVSPGTYCCTKTPEACKQKGEQPTSTASCCSGLTPDANNICDLSGCNSNQTYACSGDGDSQCCNGQSCESGICSKSDIESQPNSPCPDAADTGECNNVPTAFGNWTTNPQDIVEHIFSILLSVSGGIAVLLIMAGGYKIIMSNGNPEKVEEAREQITAAVIGLLFIIFSMVILQFIGVDVLRLPGFTGNEGTVTVNQ